MSDDDIVDRAADFAERAHSLQLRRYTGEKYFVHLCEVAALVAQYGLSQNAIAAAYLHDVIEDTLVTYSLVKQEFGQPVADMVLALTNEAPRAGVNRSYRHACDVERLAAANSETQSIKCADLISNTTTIVQYDPGFAVKYLAEKRDILTALRKAEPRLEQRAWDSLHTAEAELVRQGLLAPRIPATG